MLRSRASKFRGRNEHHRSHYALGIAAMIRAGVQPDLLGEIQWWGTDDLWEYALYALVVYVRIAAERTGQPVGEICARLAARHGLETAAERDDLAGTGDGQSCRRG